MKVHLKQRTICPDGTIEVKPEQLEYWLSRGIHPKHLAVESLTPEVAAYNRFATDKLKVGASEAIPPLHWVLPDAYKYLNLEDHLLSFIPKLKQDHLYEVRLKRFVDEVVLFIELGYSDLIRTLLYVLDTMEQQGVVWGVGRGSSCSSYLFHVLGLHEVDCVLYEIPITDFLKEALPNG